MILLHQDTGWVRDQAGRASAFDSVRLTASLRRAAQHIGLADWWQAEPVAEAVRRAVLELCPQRTIGMDELTRVIVEILQMLGYNEVAQAYRQRRQYAAIQLDQLDAQLELGFFHRLDSALQIVADTELQYVELRGLRGCVMQLRGARHWGGQCRRQADEIVNHVRQRVAQQRPVRAEALRLTVME
jgi:hypothetical protein